MPKNLPSALDTARYHALLLETGYITADQITHAQNASEKNGVYLGEVLISLGLMTPRQVAEVTSKFYGLPAVDLDAEDSIDEAYLLRYEGQHFIKNMWLPLFRNEKQQIVVATVFFPTPDLVESVKSYLQEEDVTFVISTSWSIRRTLLRIFASRIAQDASMALYEKQPQLSAKQVLNGRQKIGLYIGLAVLLLLIVAFPLKFVATALAVMSIAFFGSIIYKYYICLLGSQYDTLEKISKKQVDSLKDEDLPVYTVLVPVYKEENIVAQLVGNLGDIDYPEDKLEVLILTEEDDQLTRDAIAKASPPRNFHVITVPDGQPRTKPRACNVGMYLAKGEYLVIYDAEDTPEPDQLKKAVIAFQNGDPSLVCVQAALNYFNDEENFLTRMFTLEYSYWFDYMLTGLEHAKMPIPLGGTSNHFKTNALTTLGGWDSWNVTEDADLGIRASALGYTVGTINSTTMEEANTSIPNFIRQRSRWIKGYIQTTLVHLREPVKLVKAAGLKQALGFLFLIGGTPATFLAVIPLYILSLFIFFGDHALLTQIIPEWVLVLCLLNLFLGNLLMIHISMLGPFKRKRFRLVAWALLNPLYWMLHSISSYKALWQVIVNPHYWEKTNHGLTKQHSEGEEHE